MVGRQVRTYLFLGEIRQSRGPSQASFSVSVGISNKNSAIDQVGEGPAGWKAPKLEGVYILFVVYGRARGAVLLGTVTQTRDNCSSKSEGRKELAASW